MYISSDATTKDRSDIVKMRHFRIFGTLYIPIFEWGAVLKKSCIFCVVQILNNGSCRDMWMIICVYIGTAFHKMCVKCVDIWEATPHNLLEINAWNLASALSMWFSSYMYGLYCVSLKIWLHLPPWYNRTGWLGIKHQFMYLHIILI